LAFDPADLFISPLGLGIHPADSMDDQPSLITLSLVSGISSSFVLTFSIGVHLLLFLHLYLPFAKFGASCGFA
jgi:hypothetical protein